MGKKNKKNPSVSRAESHCFSDRRDEGKCCAVRERKASGRGNGFSCVGSLTTSGRSRSLPIRKRIPVLFSAQTPREIPTSREEGFLTSWVRGGKMRLWIELILTCHNYSPNSFSYVSVSEP
ncbi:hypothetical protein CEXT_54011 [Caerostris extrusa]|uniref:Uncharacterized protein n=1 Tax=Caerostris extrusa TaxID=172846 RepID=A0AAV4TQ23_CAEEX|nr:hypothetical protein CEXT_54011 [Caerostris extrusa]